MRDFLKAHRVPILLSAAAVVASTAIALAPVLRAPEAAQAPQQASVSADAIADISARLAALEDQVAGLGSAPTQSGPDLDQILARLVIVEKGVVNQSRRVTRALKALEPLAGAGDKLALLEKGVVNQSRRVTRALDALEPLQGAAAKIALLEKGVVNQSRRVTRALDALEPLDGTAEKVALLEKGVVNQSKRVTRALDALEPLNGAADKLVLLEKGVVNQSRRVSRLNEAMEPLATLPERVDRVELQTETLGKAATRLNLRVAALKDDLETSRASLDVLAQEVSGVREGLEAPAAANPSLREINAKLDALLSAIEAN
ncbi:MAG: hypothetical protein AAGH83_06220 [Pseudomonadota bacterium]